MFRFILYMGISACLPAGQCANILGIWFYGWKSHHILGEMLLKELARRGHNVTMASPFPLKKPFPNYTDVHLTGILEDQMSRDDQFMKMYKGDALVCISSMMAGTRAQTEMTLNHTEMKKLVTSGTKFDVIIIDWFLNAAVLVFGSIFDAPVIPIASQGTTFIATAPVGCPSPPSYVPSILFDSLSNMTFLQRMANGVMRIILQVVKHPNTQYHMGLVRKYYGDAHTFEGLIGNIALILSNGHYSYESPRPYVPNLIPVGGFHVQKPGKLPEDLQAYMNTSKNGVIYFSLGSSMKSIFLPKETREAILKVFSQLPYNILWKWEESGMHGKSDNVKLGQWFPQNEILAHPNTKLFISHGGLLSTIEAIHHGIPMLGIPIFGDQRSNVKTAVQSGYALHLELGDLTEDTFKNALHELLNNPRYKSNAERRSRLLKDQPLPPMEQAVFWVEHVIRNKGAPHLRNAGVDLPFYQYLLLDVAAVVVMAFAIISFIIYSISKCIVSFPSGKKRRTMSQSNKKSN